MKDKELARVLARDRLFSNMGNLGDPMVPSELGRELDTGDPARLKTLLPSVLG